MGTGLFAPPHGKNLDRKRNREIFRVPLRKARTTRLWNHVSWIYCLVRLCSAAGRTSLGPLRQLVSFRKRRYYEAISFKSIGSHSVVGIGDHTNRLSFSR